MPGLVPGIRVLSGNPCIPVLMRGTKQPRAARIFLIIRVDAMFTTFIERPFTKAFDAIAPTATIPCVSRARNCD
jgi:hypothetical protein